MKPHLAQKQTKLFKNGKQDKNKKEDQSQTPEEPEQPPQKEKTANLPRMVGFPIRKLPKDFRQPVKTYLTNGAIKVWWVDDLPIEKEIGQWNLSQLTRDIRKWAK